MNLIGNQKIKDNLENSIQNNKISHSYLFIGTKGVGKILFAREFAKGILCMSDQNKPCRQCQACISFTDNNHPDYYEMGLEEGENSIKIDAIRQMQRKIQEKPIVSTKKVYVIDCSESMTKEAQNCLLKTLEEPPVFVTIILITNDENKILSTIQSRCVKMHFQNLSQEEMKQYIQNNLEEDFTESMLVACQGSIGKAQQILKNKELFQQVEELLQQMNHSSITEIMLKAEILYKNKENIQELLEYMNALFIKKAKENLHYVNYIQYVEEAKRDLSYNANYEMTIDRLLFRIGED